MNFIDVITQGTWKSRPALFRRDQIIVSVESQVPEQNIQQTIKNAINSVSGADVISYRPGRRWAIVSIPQGVDPVATALSVASFSGIRYAEPDFLMQARGTVTPTDTNFGLQLWADTIRLPEAWWLIQDSWGLPVGSPDVLIAVLDSGIQMAGAIKVDHRDFDPARFIVTHLDDVGAYESQDFWQGDVLPIDENGHGTEVTGIIAAKDNNSEGMAGINWVSPVFVARVLDSGAHTCVGAVKEAMDVLAAYAEREDYDRVVVNLSLGSTYPSEVDSLTEMIEDADPDKFLLCCAPGFYVDTSSGTAIYHADYPSRYAATYGHVISVGESDVDDNVRTPYATMTLADTNDVTVVAPGEDAYTTTLGIPADATTQYGESDGTSMACAMVSGVTSLMWSISPWLTPAQIKSCLVSSGTAVTLGTVEFKRIDAAAALEAVHAYIAVTTPTLAFIDVAAGEEAVGYLELTATGCASLDFIVLAPAGLDAAFAVESDTMSYAPGSSGVVTGASIRYTAGAAGTSAFGRVLVTLDRSDLSWEIMLVGNSVAPVEVAVALVADTSNSMSRPTGVAGELRVDALRQALNTVVNVLPPGCSCGLVRFDGSAHVVQALGTIVRAVGDPVRGALIGEIGRLAPARVEGTSIAAGIIAGNHMVIHEHGRSPAVLVLTDGNENTAPLIKDVMRDFTAPVFAVAMANQQSLTLSAFASLATATGGRLLLVDFPVEENWFQIRKYVFQMISMILGETMLVDPLAHVHPDRPIEMPFWLTSQEHHCRVTLMSPANDMSTFELVPPGGKSFSPKKSPKGVVFHGGPGIASWSFRAGAESPGRKPGRWSAKVSIGKAQFKKYVEKAPKARRPAILAHGVPCNLVVTARSSLRLNAQLHPQGSKSGSRVLIRAVMRDGGREIALPVSVSARIEAPDGTFADVKLERVGTGAFEHAFVAQMEGIYVTTVRASGYNVRQEFYTREQVLTTLICDGSRAPK